MGKLREGSGKINAERVFFKRPVEYKTTKVQNSTKAVKLQSWKGAR